MFAVTMTCNLVISFVTLVNGQLSEIDGPCLGEDSMLCSPPCQVSQCSRYPEAMCVNDYCKCKARYYLNGQEVTQFCPSSPPLCPDGSQPYTCTKEPCQVQTCQAYPNATCWDDYCGGCSARFRSDSRDVTYECCSSPPVGMCNQRCRPDLCNYRFCPRYPTATCIIESCGGCRLRWFLPDCSEVTTSCLRINPPILT